MRFFYAPVCIDFFPLFVYGWEKKGGICMRYMEKHPMAMIVLGVLGISVSSILVKFSAAPSAVTAAWRLLWTVALMSPVVWGRGAVRRELLGAGWRLAG